MFPTQLRWQYSESGFNVNMHSMALQCRVTTLYMKV